MELVWKALFMFIALMILTDWVLGDDDDFPDGW